MWKLDKTSCVSVIRGQIPITQESPQWHLSLIKSFISPNETPCIQILQHYQKYSIFHEKTFKNQSTVVTLNIIKIPVLLKIIVKIQILFRDVFYFESVSICSQYSKLISQLNNTNNTNKTVHCVYKECFYGLRYR